MSGDITGLPLLALLGCISGAIAGGLIILFRLSVESGSLWLIGSQSYQDFESLTALSRLLICFFGALIVGLLLHYLNPKARIVGVVHVLERLDYHQGHLPIKNALVQFVGASLSLITGQSVGREGPSVHLGAASGSLLGRVLRIPNNSTRVLVACGVAAAISAAFDTPLAGVIFAMEVVLMEYTVVGFTPVILAAVSSTSLTRLTFGNEPLFNFPIAQLSSTIELPIVALMGAIIGILAALFIRATTLVSSMASEQSIWARCALAGLITGLIALQFPQVMGIGYDTIDQFLLGQLSLGLVIMILLAKFLATTSAIGLGIPAGLIGPTLFLGAAAGGIIGILASGIIGESVEPGVYAMLGMAAMMAATLQAPLAALVYLLELSGEQAIILPGMAAVVSASLITRSMFGKSSIYRHIMLGRGLDYRNTALSIALRRVGVASVMDRGIQQQQRLISSSKARELLLSEPRWILLKDEDKSRNFLLPATDLARFLNELDEQGEPQEEVTIDLLAIPAKRLDTASTTIIATLQEAYEQMQRKQCQALFICGAHGANKHRVYGVITREHIERSYQT